MHNEKATVTRKISDMQAAHKAGTLKSHAVVKSMRAADTDVNTSWGPAMRR